MSGDPLKRYRELFQDRARLAVVLGSGLAAVEGLFETREVIPYDAFPGFDLPTAPGHPGRLVCARIARRCVLICAGRRHRYEGCDFEVAGGVVAMAAALGCRAVLLTQAAGALHRRLPLSAWMVPSDVVWIPTAGLRLPGAGGIGGDIAGRPAGGGPVPLISPKMRSLVEEAVRRSGAEVFGGTLCWTPGPTYETNAEARVALSMGADAANMSCLPELVAARSSGIEAACLSLITNYTANCTAGRTDHGEILLEGGRAAQSLLSIIAALEGLTGPHRGAAGGRRRWEE